MREQVVTPRAGRATPQGKGRNAAAGNPAAQQRPAARKSRPAHAGGKTRARGSWRKAVRFAPLVAKGVLAVCAGLLAFAGYRAAASASFFQLKTVEVEGASRSSRDDIKDAVERAVSPVGVWDADLDALSNDLREMTWVRAAYVQRVLPSGVRVHVVEREPKMVARNAAGRLIWVDDEGVALGTASAPERDFIIRGLDEARTPQARQRNTERMAAVLAMKREWERAGLSERVSEVDLHELRDVRVQLAGADARIEVRLGREDYASRFREALRKLDEQRETPLGAQVIYIDMTTGRNAIFGYPQEARTAGQRATAEGSNAGAQPREEKPAENKKKGAQSNAPRPDSPRAERVGERQRGDKREAAAGKPAAALRARRVGQLN